MSVLRSSSCVYMCGNSFGSSGNSNAVVALATQCARE
jgi:hypothetical protein